ncbi:MAG TPA: hypothetical protein VJ867_14220 [Gemmatimonadaceae bacterium]|nr:hypothetical protein [Gemmatimonadaceae bacterium]
MRSHRPTIRAQSAEPPGPPKALAIIGFGHGGEDQVRFPVFKASLTRWTRATTVAVPTAASMEYEAVGVGDSTPNAMPIVFWVRGRPATADKPARISVDLLGVGEGKATRAEVDEARSSAPAQACFGSGWVSAFFVDSTSEPSSAPVLVRMTDDVGHWTIKVDPARDVVHLEQWQHVRRGDLPLEDRNERVWTLNVNAADSLHAIALVAHADSTGMWTFEGGPLVDGHYQLRVERAPDGPRPVDWRVYLLEGPPPCPDAKRD